MASVSAMALVGANDTALIPSCGNALKRAFCVELSEQFDVATVTLSSSDIDWSVVGYEELVSNAETKCLHLFAMKFSAPPRQVMQGSGSIVSCMFLVQ